jgi:hypothetical protein
MDTLFDRSAGLETHIAHQIVDVGPSCGYVTRLHRKQIFFGFPAELLFQK